MANLTTRTQDTTPVGGDQIYSMKSPFGATDDRKVNISDLGKGLDPTVIPNTSAGNIAATNVQAAINELDTKKAAISTYDPQAIAGDAFLRSNHNGVFAADKTTTATDPVVDAAVTTAIIDANDAVIVKTNTTGNNQTLGTPTGAIAGKRFYVINDADSTDAVPVIYDSTAPLNLMMVQAGEALEFVFDGAKWTVPDEGKTAGEFKASTSLIVQPTMSINADPTKYDLSAYLARFITRDTSTGVITSKIKYFAAQTGLTPAFLGLAPATGILQAEDGTITPTLGEPTYQQLASNVYLGTAVHTAGVSIEAINDITAVYEGDLARRAFGTWVFGTVNVNNNTQYQPNGANLFLDFTGGYGVTMKQTKKNVSTNPHELMTLATTGGVTPGVNTTWFITFRTTDAGADGTFFKRVFGKTAIDVGVYDDGTAVQADVLPQGSVGNNQYVILHCAIDFALGTKGIQIGQNVYSSIADAKADIDIDLPADQVDPVIAASGTFINRIIVKGNATALNNSAEAFFGLVAPIGGGTGVGGGTTSIQSAYNVSEPSAEFSTNATQEALTGREGTGDDTQNVYEVKNNAGVITVGLQGDGNIDFNAANHSIGASLGANTLTIGGASSIVQVDGALVADTPVVANQVAIKSYVDGLVNAAIRLQGDWNASTNTPDITGTTTTGFAWRVSVAGSTNLGGITTWAVGDLAVKTDSSWLRIANEDVAAVWGNISGTLSNQTDLQSALDAKLDLAGGTMTGNIAMGGNNIVGAGSVAATGTVSGTTLTGTLSTAAQPNITSTGALNSGSITSGFGSIDTGASSITTTGVIQGFFLTSAGSFGQGRLYDNANQGTVLTSKTGVDSDFTLFGTGGNTVFRVPTGTNNTDFSSNSITTTGAINGGALTINGGQSLFDRNTTALPGIAFRDDTNTGFRGGTGDIMYAITGGAIAQTWDASGNSDFAGNSITTTGAVNSGNIVNTGNVNIGSTSGTAKVTIIKDGAYNSEGTNGIKIQDLATSQTVSMNIGVDATNNISFIQSMEPLISFSTRPLVLQGNGGNVGIGTITPNYGGFTKVVTLESTLVGGYELASTRADADGVQIGALSFNYRTNSASHNLIGQVDVVTDGTTANQRGGAVRFLTKLDGSTAIQEAGRFTQQAVLQTKEQASTPLTPSFGFAAMYAKTDGEFYGLNDAGVEKQLSGGGGGGSSEYLVVEDKKTSGTDGGSTGTANTFTTRDLNTVQSNTITGASLSTNQITLPAGTYRIRFSAPAYLTSGHIAKLRNITDSTDDLTGSSSQAEIGSPCITRSQGEGVITIAGTKVFEIQHAVVSQKAADGFGNASGFAGIQETYTQVFIQKI